MKRCKLLHLWKLNAKLVQRISNGKWKIRVMSLLPTAFRALYFFVLLPFLVFTSYLDCGVPQALDGGFDSISIWRLRDRHSSFDCGFRSLWPQLISGLVRVVGAHSSFHYDLGRLYDVPFRPLQNLERICVYRFLLASSGPQRIVNYSSCKQCKKENMTSKCMHKSVWCLQSSDARSLYS